MGRTRKVRIVTAVVVVVLAVAAMLVVVTSRGGGAPVVTTSSGDASEQLAARTDDGGRAPAWSSDDEAVGASVDLTWPRPIRMNRIVLRGVEDPSSRISSALVVFDGGSGVLVTPDAQGDVDASFAPREATTVRVVVAGAPAGSVSVGLAHLSVTDDGSLVSTGAEGAEISASSAGDVASRALADGVAADGDPGEAWTASAQDTAPWVEMTWDSAREVASAQVVGPAETAFEPSYDAAAPLNGRLVFDDGSSVVVSGIASGEVQPTTVAFAPRTTTTVRLEIEKTIPQATFSLREFTVAMAGTTPERWPTTSATYSTAPVAAETCSDTSGGGGGGLRLICPAVGSRVSGSADVVIGGAPGQNLLVSATPVTSDGRQGSVQPVTTATTDADGRAEVRVDVSRLPAGPLTLEVTAASSGGGSADEDGLFVQLFNTGGLELAADPYGHAGMTLQWEEEFSDPLAISGTGAGADYAAAKPAYWGRDQFGDAVFADPEDGHGNISTGDGYLRLRNLPIEDPDEYGPYGQRHYGGIVSSLRVGASGFSSQYGYFEARMLGAPGTGSWPAFWMLNSQSATKDNESAGEADAVELYGHDPYAMCHNLHVYPDSTDEEATCLDNATYAPWTMAWHTYGIRILPDGAEFFVDGQQVTVKDGLGRYDEPFFFMIDQALGGGWPVDLSPTSETTDLYVDWVRAYS